jgi:hypothetical protein
MLATAKRKEREALKAVPAAEAKLLEQFRSDPKGFLARAGISVQQWLNRVAADGADADPAATTSDDRLAAIEKRQLEAEKATALAERNAAIATVNSYVKNDPAYALVNKTGNHALVIEVLDEYYETHRKALPWKVAAKQVEDYLRALSGAPPAEKAPATAPPATSTRQAAVTLTNNNTGNAASTKDELPTDPDERLKAVMRLI